MFYQSRNLKICDVAMYYEYKEKYLCGCMCVGVGDREMCVYIVIAIRFSSAVIKYFAKYSNTNVEI